MIYKATLADKQNVIDIILDAYKNNPSYLATIRHAANPEKSMKALAIYAFNTAWKRRGIYISSDGKGVAIWFRKDNYIEGLGEYWDQFLLVWRVIGFKNVQKTLAREAYINSFRPADKKYIYFWFYGVKDDAQGGGAAVELKNAVFEDAKKQGLPIYLETSVEKNKRVYERYGFDTYHTWYNEDEGITRYFIRREF